MTHWGTLSSEKPSLMNGGWGEEVYINAHHFVTDYLRSTHMDMMILCSYTFAIYITKNIVTYLSFFIHVPPPWLRNAIFRLAALYHDSDTAAVLHLLHQSNCFVSELYWQLMKTRFYQHKSNFKTRPAWHFHKGNIDGHRWIKLFFDFLHRYQMHALGK